MMLKIKEAENTHVIAELKQRIAELEIQVRYSFYYKPKQTIDDVETQVKYPP